MLKETPAEHPGPSLAPEEDLQAFCHSHLHNVASISDATPRGLTS